MRSAFPFAIFAVFFLVTGIATACGNPEDKPDGDSKGVGSRGTSSAVAGDVDSGFADVNGTSLYYEVRGEGSPLVLIQGGNLVQEMWEDQLEEFSKGYRVVTYDVRGFGRSGPWGDSFRACDDLKGLLDFLDIEQAHLVGLWSGGRIAVDFALEFPDRVGALVLAGPGLSGYDWSQSDQSWVEPDTEEPISPPAIERLADISAPTLLILGDKDVADIERIAGILQEGISGSKLERVQGSGHMVSVKWPETFNWIALEFLKGM